jgi:hypothetical protein
MTGKRRWIIMAGVVLAQVGIVVGYLQLQTANSAQATAEQPAQAEASPPPAPEAPAPLARPDKEPLPAAARGPLNEAAEAPPALAPPLGASKDASAAAATPAPSAATIPAVSPTPAPPGPPASDNPLPPASGSTSSAPPAPVVPVSVSVQRTGPRDPTVAQSPALTQPSAAPPSEPPPAAVKITSPWKIYLSIVEGRTVLTAKTGAEVQFKVTCDKLDLQAPHGAIQAAGAVKLSSNDLDGTGERLTINLQEDKVILDGRAELRARREGQELELQADHLSLRIVGGRLSTRAEAVP